MWYNKSSKEVEIELETNVNNGLSLEQVNDRNKLYGKNELLITRNSSWYFTFVLSFLNPLSLILIVLNIVLVVTEKVLDRDISLINLLVILFIVFVNAIIETVEKLRVHKSINNLKVLTDSKVFVKRENNIIEILSSELVIGDIVVLDAGKYVPADIRIIESDDLQIDESNLTGESVPVLKKSESIKYENQILADQYNMAFKSTFVVKGKGLGIVTSIGFDSEIGKIIKGLEKDRFTKTPLQFKLNKLVKLISIISVLLSLFIFLYFSFIYGFNNDWLNVMIIAVSISIAIIPESLTVIISLVLSYSIRKMMKINIFIKKLDIVEAFGSLDVVCSDKTGTLTKNEMIVDKIIINNRIVNKIRCEINDCQIFHFINCLTLCNDAVNENNEKNGEPTEIALVDFVRKFIIKESSWRKKYKRIIELPFDSNRKLMSTINCIDEKKFVYTKGAIDCLLKKCSKIFLDNNIVSLTDNIRNEIYCKSIKLSEKALRVLAFAFKEYQDNNEIEDELIFLGAIGLFDPPRIEVTESIEKMHNLGIRVIMITGDHLITAFTIAKKLSIVNSKSEIMLGEQIDKLSDDELRKKLTNINVFARVNPEHKTRIVNNLQKMNYTVAMIGDGVNDASSLNKADVGVAMGVSGTDISKEAADVILQDDNFLTFVKGIEEGRNVFTKISKVITFIISANIAQVLSFLFILITTNIKPFDSVNILWFNLIVETLLAIPIGLGEQKFNSLMYNDKIYGRNLSFLSKNLVTIIFVAFATCFSVIMTFFIGLYFMRFLNPIPQAKISSILVMSCSPSIYAYMIYSSSFKNINSYIIINNNQKIVINWYLIVAVVLVLVLNFVIIFVPVIRNIFLLPVINSDNNSVVYNSPPFLSWQMILVSICMMFVPSILLFFYQGFYIFFIKKFSH